VVAWSEWEGPGLSLRLTAGDSGLRAIEFAPVAPPPGSRQDAHPLLTETRRQLQEYFEGLRREFTLPLDPRGTDFQLRVWRALQSILYGETRSYGELAQVLGMPHASRAVGAANGANPLPIVIPCHRVVGSTGKLVGYGGGLPMKKRLLELERDVCRSLCQTSVHSLSIT
jgi:methylated-DNA-[protein]-cysteine S-methyltransferase